MPRFVFLLALVLSCCLLTATPLAAGPIDPTVKITGTLYVLWSDARPGAAAAGESFFIYDDTGRATELRFAGRLNGATGELLAFDRRRVQVTGAWERVGVLSVDAINLALTPGASVVPGGSVTGSHPWVSVLCKFADVATEGQPLSYFTNMYGSTKPGLDHYWREQSYDIANVLGSDAVGWYTLPQPRSYYVWDRDGDGDEEFDHGRALTDCTTVADDDVYFPTYDGINLMFNQDLDCCAWGGGAYLTIDGVSRSYRTTYEPPWGWSNQSVIGHEMGHGFGMPHSSGQYGQTYDNQWDVMSDTWANCAATQDPVYGCVGQHTIGFHKRDKVGWIGDAQTYVANAFEQTITLERLALPQTGNTLLARIPIGVSTTHFYTVEARQQAGYDLKLPGQGVIIHDVDTTRANQAQVIDSDGNGDTGDAGAVWSVGETYSDETNDISVTVDSATATGFAVTIRTKPIPQLLTPAVDEALPPGDIDFSWAEIADATGYQLQVDTVATFDSVGLIDQTVTGASTSIDLPTVGARYWRVRALPGGPWTAARRFMVARPLVQVTTDASIDYWPSITRATDGRLWSVWYSARSGNWDVWTKSSIDEGVTWTADTQLTTYYGSDFYPAMTASADGKLWVVWISYRSGNYDLWYKTTLDGGVTWSPDTQLTTHTGTDIYPAAAQAGDGKLWVVWSSSRSGNYDVWIKRSTDGGATWSVDTQLTTNASEDTYPAVAQASDGKLWVVWMRDGDLWRRTSADDGLTWSLEAVLDGECCHRRSGLTAATSGVLWLASARSDEIWLRSSADHGDTWTLPVRLTRFAGPDEMPALAPLTGGRVGVAWQSIRASNFDIWYGIPGEREDLSPPPYVSSTGHLPSPNPEADDIITFRAWAQDETGVAAVALVWTLDGVNQGDLPMFDDGAHGDDGAGDGIWGVQHAPLPEGSQVSYRARATDSDGNIFLYVGTKSFAVLAPFVKMADLLLVPDYGGNDTAWFQLYYTNALNSLNFAYDLWDTKLRGSIPGSILNQYVDGAVIWGVPYWGYVTHTDTARAALQGYLDAGGALFISGQNVAEYLNGSALLTSYLHATFIQANTGLYDLAGASGDPIGGGLTLDIFGGDGANNQNSKDEIDPLAPAVVAFTYQAGASPMPRGLALPDQEPPAGDAEPAAGWPELTGAPGLGGRTVAPAGAPQASISSGTAGLHVDTGSYKVVYLAFGFEAINALTDRIEVMKRALAWLGVCATPAVPGDVTVRKENEDAVLDWSDAGAASYEVSRAANAPYFTPAETCAAPSCEVVTTNGYRHSGAFESTGSNYTYTVRAVNACGGRSGLAHRVGGFSFDLVRGLPQSGD